MVNPFLTDVLWTGPFMFWIRDLTHDNINLWRLVDCKIGRYLYDLGRFCSSAILVILCVEKCIALYFPFKTKNICTVRKAKWVTFIVVSILAIYNLHQFFMLSYSLRKKNGDKLCYPVSDIYRKISVITRSSLYSFGPFILMIILNGAIIFKFISAKLESSRHGTESTNQALSKHAMKGTTMVIAVSAAFIILTGPVAVVLVLQRAKVEPNRVFYAISGLLEYSNHTINGVLYCVVGSRFRKELSKILYCENKNLHSNNSNVTVTSTDCSVMTDTASPSVTSTDFTVMTDTASPT